MNVLKSENIKNIVSGFIKNHKIIKLLVLSYGKYCANVGTRRVVQKKHGEEQSKERVMLNGV